MSTPDDEAVLTKTQARDKILRRVRALYTLASRGEEATHEERDGFNLIAIERSDLVRWGSSHEWKRGCTDMSHLPEAVTAVRNVKDWSCVNTSVGGTTVFFKRKAPAIRCRGCGASERRKRFKWTPDMNVWLHKATSHLHKKSIGFTELAAEAFRKWGHSAPEYEHLNNRIKSRDQARKEGREVRWVTTSVDL